MNLAQALLRALHQHGAREIFGIPGDFALAFFKQIEESSILPLYTLSHEPAVGFAADASARLHSGLGVAAVTYGAGALNMVNAVASSFAEKVPLVVISGAPSSGEWGTGLLLHHQTKSVDSQMSIFREITCDQIVLNDAATAPELIARALHNCLAQSRPVYIELPRDMVLQPCLPVVMLPAAKPDQAAIDAAVTELLDKLISATSPVMMVGVEIKRYGIENKVAQLAQLLNIPVVTSFMGRGLLANAATQPLGTYLGMAGTPEITQLVEHSDALLLLGVIISDTNFGVSEKKIDMRKSILARDRCVSMGYHTYSDIPLEALVDGLIARAAPLNRQSACTIEPYSYPVGLKADQESIAPIDIARAINDLILRVGNMPIASDIGDCLFTALDIANTDLVAPGYYATMGYGIPAGIGLQAGSNDRPLILVGDGAFQMTGWELGNCQRYGWDPIVIVFNNCSWEMLRTFQPESSFNNLSDWHFADLAKPLGGQGYRVQTRGELSAALQTAHQLRGKFQLIEVMLPRGVLSDTLTRYVSSIKRMHQIKAT